MEPPSQAETRLPRAVAVVRGAMECVVLVLACASPWALGAVHPSFEALLYTGVALLLLLWAARALLEGRLTWRRCPVLVCLGGLFLLGVVEVAPLPRGILARLSPAAVRLYEDLLPAERETLPSPDTIPAVPVPAGNTLSLSPAGTREELLRLLAVFVLFAAVRYNVASAASLRRLAVGATVNGAALSLFAFLQFFSAPRLTVYWALPVLPESSPFGPFICRNHFPFYLNLCVGLAVGLLLTRRDDTADDPTTRAPGWRALELLNDPAALWIGLALALMLAAVAFSLSRGGLVALAVACLVALLLRAGRSSRPARWGGVLLAAAMGLGLLGWLGAGPLRARLATLWQGDAMREGRAEIWAGVLPVVKDFPLCGTGYGTFERVEEAYRTSPAHKGWVVGHAHNDYLEALVEGGAVRLLLSVAAILLVYRLGRRALRRYRGQATEGLALGALLGFTTVVVQSAVDFGLHIPAIAAMATVVAAHIAALGEKHAASPRARPAWTGRLAALAATAPAVALALLLGGAGWRMAEAESLRIRAHSCGGDEGLRLLDDAARTAPERAALHFEAGQAYARRYEEDRAAGRAYLMSALAHFVQARDLCPLSARTQLRLATHRDGFARAEPRDVYTSRAVCLLPSDPELHYLAGCLELADGQRARAEASWRRSLALADTYQEAIVGRARGVLTDAELLDDVLPDQPRQLVAAAEQLYPEPDAAGRQPFFKKALALLRRPGAARSAEDYHLKAVLHEALGEPAEAAAAYEAALHRAPRETEWRCALALLLRRQGRLEDARRQVREVLAEHPDHREGLRLLEAIARDRAERE